MLFKVFLILSSGNPFVRLSVTICAIYGRKYKEDQFCESILNFGQWFKRRCRLKDFLSGALAALLCGEAKPFMQF